MGENINVSIIIPHYNTPKLLKVLLDSVPQRDDVQVIVIDDKSTKEVDYYRNLTKDSRYKHVTFLTNNRKNKGAGAARNVGLEIAEGKWLLFADADDRFTDNMYDSIRKYFECSNDIVYFPFTSVYESGEMADRHIEFSSFVDEYRQDSTKRINEVNLKYRFTIPSTRLIRKSMVDEHNIVFDETIYSNDVMFSVKTAYYASSIMAAEDQIYVMLEHEGSLCKEGDDESIEQRTRILVKRYQFLKEHLSKEDFNMLDLAALGRINTTLRNPYCSKATKKKTLSMIFDAHMRIIPRRLFKPSYWLKRLSK